MRKKIASFLRWSALFLSIVVAFPMVYAAAQNSSPSAVIEELNAKLLEAMKGGNKLGYDGRYALLEPVIHDIFDIDLMTRISMGRHWKNMSENQRNQMIALYQQWSIATYAQRFDTYEGQRFEVLPEQKVQGSSVIVCSHLIKKTGEVVDFLYKLKKARNKWLIVDIHVKGVSQLANTRAQFTSILDRDGYDVLVKKLEEKIDDLSS
jgi:phospholipid transport system substrate-binding protein